MNAPRARKNLYRGSMDREQAAAKLDRIARRLELTSVVIGHGRTKHSARVAFKFRSARVERICDTQADYEANLACLALWLEDRARNLERGIESFTEAFADSLSLSIVGDSDGASVRKAAAYTGQKNLEACIRVFRSSLARLGIEESNVKLTWDAEQNHARLRMRLPSGAIVEKTSRLQRDHIANVAALGLWLQSRTRNWERGIESMDLERVFAGNLLPARVG